MKEWACRYRLDGHEWGITVMADDAAEASRRLRAIGTTGQVDGEIMLKVPAYPGVGLAMRIVTATLNLFRRTPT